MVADSGRRVFFDFGPDLGVSLLIYDGREQRLLVWLKKSRDAEAAAAVVQDRRIFRLGDDEEVTEEHRHLGHHEDHGDEGESSTANEHTPLVANGSAHAEDDEESTDLEPLHERVTGASQDRVKDLALQREETRSKMKDSERDALLVTKVRRDDGTEAEVIVGQSTQPQTIFNSSNTFVKW